MTNLLKIFKAFSDETRIDILRSLLAKKEISCRELSGRFPLSQPALSHHFNKLIDAEIIIKRKNGTAVYYSINYKYLQNYGFDIKKITQKGA